jgi:hypothetical protein
VEACLTVRSRRTAAPPLNSSVRHVMNLSREDQIWNRACLESGGASPAAGDQALAALLLAHNLAMNGGVVHALECLSAPEVSAAIAGFNYFGLLGASQVFQLAPDDSEETEERFNQMYWAAVPGDETINTAFRIKFLSSPEAFAPIGSGAHV